MCKNVFFTTILLFLIVADVSQASFFWNVRKLTASSPKEDPNTTVSPIPSPGISEKQSSPVVGADNAEKKQNQQPRPASTSGEDKSKDKLVNNKKGLIPPTAPKEENKTPVEVKEKGKNKSNLPTGGSESESCDGVDRRCQDTKSMIACIKSFDEVTKALVLLIQNKGDRMLEVDVTIPFSRDKQNVIDIPKNQDKKVNLSLVNGGSNEIKLTAGNGDCVLHFGAPAAQGSYPQWLPSYSKFMTPTYGAYFLLLTTVIVVAVWACCWFRKRKKHNDIPYWELEMSMPESAVGAETAEGWDQGWDDDWDEEKAVRSPGGRNVSANGLTSRTPNKDSWEDWDD